MKMRSLSVWTPNVNIFRDPRWGRGMRVLPHMEGMHAVVLRQIGPAVVYAASRDDDDIGVLSDEEVVVDHFRDPALAEHDRDMTRLVLRAGLDVDVDARLVSLGFYSNVLGGIAAGALTVQSDVVCPVGDLMQICYLSEEI